MKKVEENKTRKKEREHMDPKILRDKVDIEILYKRSITRTFSVFSRQDRKVNKCKERQQGRKRREEKLVEKRMEKRKKQLRVIFRGEKGKTNIMHGSISPMKGFCANGCFLLLYIL